MSVRTSLDHFNTTGSDLDGTPISTAGYFKGWSVQWWWTTSNASNNGSIYIDYQMVDGTWINAAGGESLNFGNPPGSLAFVYPTSSLIVQVVRARVNLSNVTGGPLNVQLQGID